MGTCAVGIGATVRQLSLRTRAGTVAGRATPVPRTALEMAATNVESDWLEFLCSADAQQLSACAWLMTRADPELCESPLCIGHALSEQHAMRASGVAAQPAHTATLPAEMRTVSARANSRLLRVSTPLECGTGRQVSTQVRSGPLFRRKPTSANRPLQRLDDRPRQHCTYRFRRAFRGDRWIEHVGPATMLDIEVREPAAKHAITMMQVKRWLEGASTSPNEGVKKARLKDLLRSR